MTRKIPKAELIDKIEGMLLLSAYGDALGAFHELDALSGDGKVIDPKHNTQLKKGSDFPKHRFNDPWAILIDQKAVTNDEGITSDDTAFRLNLLHPWIFAQTTNSLQKDCFNNFFQKPIRVSSPHSSINQNLELQLKEWTSMFQAHTNAKCSHFYQHHSPTCFGFFQCLDLSIFCLDQDITQVFELFKNINPLDQSYGKLITGLSATLIIKLTRNQEFTSSTFSELFTELAPSISHTDRINWELITVYHQFAIDFSKREFKDDFNFLERFRKEVFLDSKLPHFNWNGCNRNNHDPLLFWMQLVTVFHRSNFQPIQSLRLLASGAGDADTLASIAGVLLGFWLGSAYLYEQSDQYIRLGDELEKIRKCIQFMYGINIRERAEKLTDLTFKNSINS